MAQRSRRCGTVTTRVSSRSPSRVLHWPPPAGRIWSIARSDGASRPLDQAPEEYARQIYPRAIEELWRETVLDGRRVGAITTNRSYRGDVWFSCWFNPLRSSYGLYHYGMAPG